LVVAVILLATKVFGLFTRKIHLTAVVGALLAGIILGPGCLNLVSNDSFLTQLSEIGVILIMFLAGLDTNFEQIKKTGLSTLVVASLGVLLPLIGGFFVYKAFYGTVDHENFVRAVFVGTIITATSVGITVETLREMGKVSSEIGSVILGAAILDDIIGILVLTIVISMSGGQDVSIAMTLIKIVGFFAFVIIVGYLAHLAFNYFSKTYGEKRRTAIYGLAFALIMSYCAEKFFGVADITGAFFAGVILCNIGVKDFIAKKINIISYMFFSPMFFASIGLKTSFESFNMGIFWFSLAFLVVAILTKIVGCGFGALMMKESKANSLAIGIGMIARGEVALIIAQKGLDAGRISNGFFPPVVLLVVISTLIAPIMLGTVIRKFKTT